MCLSVAKNKTSNCIEILICKCWILNDTSCNFTYPIYYNILSCKTMSNNDFKYYTHIIQKLLASLAGINYSISIRLVQT